LAKVGHESTFDVSTDFGLPAHSPIALLSLVTDPLYAYSTPDKLSKM
jgi:hypothetical protein